MLNILFGPLYQILLSSLSQELPIFNNVSHIFMYNDHFSVITWNQRGKKSNMLHDVFTFNMFTLNNGQIKLSFSCLYQLPSGIRREILRIKRLIQNHNEYCSPEAKVLKTLCFQTTVKIGILCYELRCEVSEISAFTDETRAKSDTVTCCMYVELTHSQESNLVSLPLLHNFRGLNVITAQLITLKTVINY